MHEATLPALAPMLANTPLKVLCVCVGCGGVWRTAGYENSKKSTLTVATNNKLH